MNCRVKQAQKEGATVGDIAAGLAISVIKNALFKVIKIRDPHDVGTKVIVQGGTFLNDAVLRAFEQLSEVHAVRPDIAGNMGAFGAALLARDRYQSAVALEARKAEAGAAVELRERRAGRARRRMLDPAHARAVGGAGAHAPAPCAARRARTTACSPSTTSAWTRPRASIAASSRATVARRARATLDESNERAEPLRIQEQPPVRLRAPRARERPARHAWASRARSTMYENYPFWFTFFTKLGCRVVLSDPSTKKTYEAGIESMPSESGVLSGEAQPRPHHESAGQGPRLHLVPVQQVGAPGGRGRGQPLQLPHRGQLPRGAAPQHRRAARRPT